jgi:hypothetical protein
MSWNSRQQRLRNMFGRQEDLCFQVVVCNYPDESNERSDFENACKKYGIECGDEDINEFFEVGYGELDFGTGFFSLNPDGSYGTYDPVMEAVYTVTDTKIINEMVKLEDSEEENALFDKVSVLYASQIEKEFGCKFNMGSKYADWGHGGLKFQFIIHPYTPQLCHPRDIGVLKPITIVDGHTIHPQQFDLPHKTQLKCE